ncbi:MAG: hypothetical protein AAF721_23190 [Myxococcota bacterium]
MGLSLAMGGLAGTAAAQPARTPVQVQWQAPAECPTQADVQAKVDALLRDGQPAGGVEPMQAEIGVRRTPEGFAASLDVTTAYGNTHRELAAATCDVIVDAAALIVVMTGQRASEQRAADPPEPNVATVPEPPEPAVPPVPSPGTRPPAPDDPTPTPRVVEGIASGGGGLDVRGLAPLRPYVGIGIGIVTNRLRVELAGQFWFRRRVALPNRDDLGAQIRLWTVGARAGTELRVRTLRFPLLLGLDVGLAHAAGFGVTAPKDARRPWLSLGAFPGLEWWFLERLGLGLEPRFAVVALRPRFGFSDAGRLPRAHAVTAGLGARILAKFP